MEGFGGFFNDPDFQKRLQDMAEQMQSSQNLAWADNAIKLAVDMTVAAINRVNLRDDLLEGADPEHPHERGEPDAERERRDRDLLADRVGGDGRARRGPA